MMMMVAIELGKERYAEALVRILALQGVTITSDQASFSLGYIAADLLLAENGDDPVAAIYSGLHGTTDN